MTIKVKRKLKSNEQLVGTVVAEIDKRRGKVIIYGIVHEHETASVPKVKWVEMVMCNK